MVLHEGNKRGGCDGGLCSALPSSGHTIESGSTVLGNFSSLSLVLGMLRIFDRFRVFPYKLPW